MKVLLTGGKGMLGRTLVRELGGEFEVVPTDLPEADITDENAIDAVFARIGQEQGTPYRLRAEGLDRRLTDEEWREYLSSPDDGTVRRLIARYDGGPVQKTPEKEQSPNSGA